MNPELTKLLNQLAGKLGTTTEYLWSVLIKQAQIDAITNLMQMVIIWGFGYVLYKIHRKLSKSNGYKHGGCLYDEYDGIGIVMIIVAMVWSFLALAAFFCIGDVVNGFLNPEYWALNRVLSTLK